MLTDMVLVGRHLYLVTNGPVKKLYSTPEGAVGYLGGTGWDLFACGPGVVVNPPDAVLHARAGHMVQARSRGGKMVFATIERMEVE